MVKIILPEDQKLIMENDPSYKEAVSLSINMVKQFYPENKEFHPLDSTQGVISQIDNMVTGLRRA